MILSAALIVKDDSELEDLKGAIASIKPFVNDIYLTANGETVSDIEQYCKSEGVHYSYFKWCDDFSAVRNFNFQQVRKDTDYILWIDKDDRLVGGEYLREVAELGLKTGKDVLFFEYWYACRFNGHPSVENITKVDLIHARERLIRPGSIRWEGMLHETPVPVDGSHHQYTQVPHKPYDPEKMQFPIAVAHMAQDGEDLLKKMARNRRILELQLEKERKRDVGADPRTLLYLMKIYAELDDTSLWDKCMEMGDEYLKKSGWNEERGTCWELMGQIEGKRGNSHRAIDCFSNAIREWPHNVLYYVRLASACYNIQDYKACKHWLEVASKMDMDKRITSGMINYHAIKAMFTDLLVKYNYNVEKDINKAYDAVKMLFEELPTEDTQKQLAFIESMKRLNDASGDLDRLTQYLYDIGQEKRIVPLLDTMPEIIQDIPFAQNLRKKFSPAKVWDDNEICYFANFNQPHFSKWDSTSLETGIGGSETAVIMLAQEWARKGYRVTIYGDPVRRGDHTPHGAMGRVIYLPYYYFNIKDKFNIFIQWRGWQLAEMIKCKRFYVDLHDIYNPIDLSHHQIDNVDKFMVKSLYQRNLAPTVSDEKFCVIGHGI